MTGAERLKEVLLGLGLEDWIPLPEAASDPEVLAATSSTEPIAALSDALTDLLRDGAISIYAGHWEADPSPVATDEALSLLGDHERYRFHTDDPSEHRVYFVNVDNVKP
jgi:hypothetical protein